MDRDTEQEVPEETSRCLLHGKYRPPISLPVSKSVAVPRIHSQITREWNDDQHTGRQFIQLFFSLCYDPGQRPKPILYAFMFRQSLDTDSEPHDNGWKCIMKLARFCGMEQTLPVMTNSAQFRYHFTSCLVCDSIRSPFSSCDTILFPNSWDMRLDTTLLASSVQYNIRTFYGVLPAPDGSCTSPPTPVSTSRYRQASRPVSPTRAECAVHASQDPSKWGEFSRELPVPTLEIISIKQTQYDSLPIDLSQRCKYGEPRGEITFRLTTTADLWKDPSLRWNLHACLHRLRCETYWSKTCYEGTRNDRLQLCSHKNRWWCLTETGPHSLPVRSKETIITITNFPFDEKLHVIAFHTTRERKGGRSGCKCILLLSNAMKHQLDSFKRTTV